MLFSSPFPDVEIPPVTVYDYLLGSLTDQDARRVAVIDGAAQLTYAELGERVEGFAGALAERGTKPGDVVGLQALNGIGLVVAFHGILRAGATVTTVSSASTPAEVAVQLRDSGATRLVTVSPLLSAAVAGAAEAGIGPGAVVVLDGADGYESLADLLATGSPAPDVSIDPATPLAALPYSSGTTGKAKGVMLAHPAIADAAVVAYPDEEGGEIPRAFIVRQGGAALTAGEVIAYVAERVAPYKRVRLVDFIDAVPKSASGKILRKNLRGRARASLRLACPQPASSATFPSLPVPSVSRDRLGAGAEHSNEQGAIHASFVCPVGADRCGRRRGGIAMGSGQYR